MVGGVRVHDVRLCALDAGEQEEIVDTLARHIGGIAQSVARAAALPRVDEAVGAQFYLHRTFWSGVEVTAEQDARGAFPNGGLCHLLDGFYLLNSPAIVARRVDVRIEESQLTKRRVDRRGHRD